MELYDIRSVTHDHDRTGGPMPVFGVFSLLISCLVFAPTTGMAQDTTLAGTWTYNGAQSDDPQAMMRELRAGDGNAPGMRGRGGRGGSARRGGQRPAGGPPANEAGDPQRMREMMRSITDAPERMAIAVNDTSVVVTYVDRPTVVLIPDGKGNKEETATLGEVETKTKWDDGELRVERKYEGGLQTRSSFLLSEDRTQLYVIIHLDGGRMPEFEFRRVYDRAPAP